MKTAVRWLLIAISVVVTLAAAGTLVPRPLFEVAAGDEVARGRRILVFSSPIHTDIAVPVEALSGPDFDFLGGANLPLDHPNARWVLFGWGGRAFYTATPELSDISLGPLVKSLTLDSSVMHVEVVGPVDEPQPYISGFTVSPERLGRVLAFIRASFADNAGAPIRIADAGYGDNDAFYEAVGSFNALVGCNTWTAAALREAGLRTGWWNPLPWTLGYSLELYN